MIGVCIESSHERGMGHFYRALNLISEFREMKLPHTVFINSHGPSLELLRKNEIPFEEVALGDLASNWESKLIRRYGIEIWVNDRLDTDLIHAHHVKHEGVSLVTFDDRGTGATEADLHVAVLAFLEHPEAAGGKKILRGLDYLVLSREIDRYKRPRIRGGGIVVSMGGTDTYGVTVKVVELLRQAGKTATIVVGPGFLHEKELERVLMPGFAVKRTVPSLIEEFSRYELAITGGGMTPFEAGASGLPSVIIANEIFEIPIGRYLDGLGCSVFAGYYENIDAGAFERDIDVDQMSRAGLDRIGTDGVKNICRELLCL